MHLWRGRQLAVELREGGLSEPDKFRYVLAAVVLHTLFGGGSQSVITTSLHDTRGLAVLGLALALSIIGIALCFQANQRGDGRQFVERYVCLAVPAMVRTYVTGYAAYYAIGLALFASRGRPGLAPFRNAWGFPFAVGIGLFITYFMVLRRYVARASGAATA